jgi:hypothetical protein
MMLGVPYRYHKELTIEVRKGGKILEGCFYLYVRNLKANIQKDGNRKLFERFHDLGYALHSSKIGGGVIEAYRFSELFRAAVALLKEDPYGFLEHPPEVRTYQE